MCGPGAYRPDPTEGMTAIADLPAPEIVLYCRNNKQQPCPRCGHSAYRDKQASGHCTTWGISTSGVRVISWSRMRSMTVRNVRSTSMWTSRI